MIGFSRRLRLEYRKRGKLSLALNFKEIRQCSKLSNNIAKTLRRSSSTALPLAAIAAGLFAFFPSLGTAENYLDKLRDEVRTFHSHAEELYRLDKDDLQICSTYCGELDPKLEEDKEAATALGRRLQDKEVGIRQQLINNEYPQLEKLARQVQVTSSLHAILHPIWGKNA